VGATPQGTPQGQAVSSFGSTAGRSAPRLRRRNVIAEPHQPEDVTVPPYLPDKTPKTRKRLGPLCCDRNQPAGRQRRQGCWDELNGPRELGGGTPWIELFQIGSRNRKPAFARVAFSENTNWHDFAARSRSGADPEAGSIVHPPTSTSTWPEHSACRRPFAARLTFPIDCASLRGRRKTQGPYR